MRFWAQKLLGAIARSHAVSTWGKLIPNDTPQALELSFACMSSFFVYPPVKVCGSFCLLLKTAELLRGFVTA
jgi:F-box protein 21